MSDYTSSMKEIHADYVACNSLPQETMGDGSLITIWQARGHFDRLLAAHDAELREQIAQEIEVHMRRHDNAQIGFSAIGDAYAHAARIARGETGEVNRCLQCGCDLRYLTAVHIVDCGPRKEQD